MNKFLKSASAIAAAAVVVGASAIAPAVLAGSKQGPDRKSYTMESLKSATFEGNKPVFNSVTDNEYINGSEFNFTGARLATATDGTRADEIIVDAGKEYLIRLYVHNNNADSTAEGVKAQVDLGGSGTEVSAMGHIKVDNGDIKDYWDDVVFKSSGSFTFHLEYEEASIATKASVEKSASKTFTLGKEITEGGALIGTDALDGKMPGCFDNAAYVYVKVKVVPEMTINKQIRLEGSKDWQDTINAKVGDTVEYRIEFNNGSNANTGYVNITDALPTNMEYVAGSAEVKNGSTNGWQSVSDGVIADGVNINSYAPGANAYLRFKAKIVDNNLNCNEGTDLRNWAKATVTGSDNKTVIAVISDHADAAVTKVCNGSNENGGKGTPGSMPSTGPAEVAGGIIGAGSLVTAAGYYIASRKQLR